MTRPKSPMQSQNKTEPEPRVDLNNIFPWVPADDPIFQRGFIIGGRRGGPRPKLSPSSGTTPKATGTDDD